MRHAVFMLGLMMHGVASERHHHQRDTSGLVQSTTVSAAHCGSWQDGYRQSFSHIDHDLMVAVPHKSGIADQITGIVTVFLWALITHRRFQIASLPGLTPLQVAFDRPYWDWDRPQDPDWLLEPLAEAAMNFNSSVSPTEAVAYNMIGGRLGHLMDGNLSSYSAETKMVLVSTNRGYSVRLFDNPHAGLILRSAGLSPETAFGCVVNYLFAPKSAVFSELLPQYHVLSNPDILKISVQIRVGDSQMRSDVHFDMYENYFNCATQIVAFALKPGQRFIWFLASDSQRIRQLARLRYGDSVVSADIVPEHSAKEASVCDSNCDVSTKGFLTAAGEWWMLGMSDYHVISADSGFGRTAAFRSLRPNATYTVRRDVVPDCGVNGYDEVRVLAADWAGI